MRFLILRVYHVYGSTTVYNVCKRNPPKCATFIPGVEKRSRLWNVNLTNVGTIGLHGYVKRLLNIALNTPTQTLEVKMLALNLNKTLQMGNSNSLQDKFTNLEGLFGVIVKAVSKHHRCESNKEK